MEEKVKKKLGKELNDWMENNNDRRKQREGWFIETHSGKLVRLKWIAEHFSQFDLSRMHTTGDLRDVFKFLEKFDFKFVKVVENSTKHALERKYYSSKDWSAIDDEEVDD